MGEEPENGRGGREGGRTAQPRRHGSVVRRGVVTHAAARTEDRAEENAAPTSSEPAPRRAAPRRP